MPRHRHLAVAGVPHTGKRARVQNWLMQAGWQVGEAQAENAAWAITAVSPAKHPVVVVQPQQPNDAVLIQANLALDKTLRQRIEALSQNERRETIWAVRLGLLQMGVEFGGIDDIPEQIVITKVIYDDARIKDTFLQRVTQVRDATLFTIWSLVRRFDEPPSNEWPENIHVN